MMGPLPRLVVETVIRRESAQPTTPPDVLAAEQPVASDREVAGGRPFTWPDQGGRMAPLSPHMLLQEHKKKVMDMQTAMKDVIKMVVSTDLHLEAAMGRNLGNTLCLNPGKLIQAVDDMDSVFQVPYSLHDTLDVFACMATW